MRATRLPQKAPKQVGEKVPESVGDIAARLNIEWREDPCLGCYFAYLDNFFVEAAEVGWWSITRRGVFLARGDDGGRRGATIALAEMVHAALRRSREWEAEQEAVRKLQAENAAARAQKLADHREAMERTAAKTMEILQAYAPITLNTDVNMMTVDAWLVYGDTYTAQERADVHAYITHRYSLDEVK